MASNVAAEQFVTLCYAEIDPRSGSLSIVNAGHVRPALLHPDGRYDLLDLPGGLPLGIMTGERYEECSLHLSPRATLLLFTDGVNEAESPSGARFDESALQETLPRLARLAPADGVDRLFDELRRFTAEDPADDVTVVALSLA
jgi:serine phosphatase RsbU (regulator of sigma subunit)